MRCVQIRRSYVVIEKACYKCPNFRFVTHTKGQRPRRDIFFDHLPVKCLGFNSFAGSRYHIATLTQFHVWISVSPSRPLPPVTNIAFQQIFHRFLFRLSWNQILTHLVIRFFSGNHNLDQLLTNSKFSLFFKFRFLSKI